jgi:hypothetical protein
VKFHGFEDPQYAAAPGGTANYALMIYDVRILITLLELSSIEYRKTLIVLR